MRHTFFQIGNVIFQIVTDGQRVVSVEYHFTDEKIKHKVTFMKYYDEPDVPTTN